MVETELIQKYGQAAVRIATASDGGVAIGTAGLDIQYRRDGKLCWTASTRSPDDKVRTTQRIRGLAFSDDGFRLYTAASDAVVAIDVSTGGILWSFTPPRSFGFLVVSAVALDANKDFVAAAVDNGSMMVWDPAGNQLGMWKTNDSPRMLRLHSGARLSGTDSFSLCTWDIPTRSSVHRRRLSERAMGFDMAQTGTIIRRSLRKVIVENVFDHEVLADLEAPSGPPLVAINPEGSRIAFAGESCITVGAPGSTPQTIDFDQRITALAHCEYERAFMVGLADGRILTVN